MGIHTSFRHLLIHFSPLWVVGAVPLGLSVGTFCRLRKLIEGVLLGHIQPLSGTRVNTVLLCACAVQCDGIKMASTEVGGYDHTASGLGVQSYLPGSASLVEDLDSKIIVKST